MDLQEGDELNLDRGALIEVGERIGSTVTDLAPLRETVRQHGSGADANLSPSSANGPVSRALPSSISRTERPPKPLSAVLGNSQGPIGRARLPNKSPFEQRQQQHGFGQQLSDVNPRKRRRLEENGQENNLRYIPGKDDLPSSRNPLPRNTFTYPGQRVGITSSALKPKATASVPFSDASTAIEEPLVHAGRYRSSEVNDGPERVQKPPPTVQPRPALMSSHQSLAIRNEQTREQREPKYATMESSSVVPNDVHRTRLKFSKKVLRPKLMYRTLLPSETQSIGGDISTKSCLETNVREKRRERNRRRHDLSAMFESSPDSQGVTCDAEAPMPTCRAPVKSPVPLQTILVSSSPENNTTMRSPTPTIMSEAEDHRSRVNQMENCGRATVFGGDVNPCILSSQDDTSQANARSDSPMQLKPPSQRDILSACTSQEVALSSKPDTALKGIVLATSRPGSPSSSKLAVLDDQMLSQQEEWWQEQLKQADQSRSQAQQPPEHGGEEYLEPLVEALPQPSEGEGLPQSVSPFLARTPLPRPFRRVVSENDSPKKLAIDHDDLLRVLDDASQSQAKLRDLSGRRENSGHPSKTPGKLQKSKSLSEIREKTSTNVQLTTDLARIDEEEVDAEDLDRGPWTANEAWDLFAWWPNNRNKPGYAIPGLPESTEDSMQKADGTDAPPSAAFQGFTSAINVL